jgi:hypothetical protein
VKRILYLLAALCFLGVGVCAVRYANLPDDIGQAMESIQNHDPSAREDVEAAMEPHQAADELLRDAGLWLVGGVVCVLLARRPWPGGERR